MLISWIRSRDILQSIESMHDYASSILMCLRIPTFLDLTWIRKNVRSSNENNQDASFIRTSDILTHSYDSVNPIIANSEWSILRRIEREFASRTPTEFMKAYYKPPAYLFLMRYAHRHLKQKFID